MCIASCIVFVRHFSFRIQCRRRKHSHRLSGAIRRSHAAVQRKTDESQMDGWLVGRTTFGQGYRRIRGKSCPHFIVPLSACNVEPHRRLWLRSVQGLRKPFVKRSSYLSFFITLLPTSARMSGCLGVHMGHRRCSYSTHTTTLSYNITTRFLSVWHYVRAHAIANTRRCPWRHAHKSTRFIARLRWVMGEDMRWEMTGEKMRQK